MDSRLLRRFWLPFAAGLALAATAPGSAVAAFGTLSYPVHGPVNGAVDFERAVTVSCQGGSHVLGGGQYVFAADEDAIVHSSAPFDGGDADKIPDDGWRSRVDSFNGASNTITEYAICSTKQPTYRSTAVTLHGPAAPHLRSNCPPDDSAVGGGVDISPKYDSAYLTVSDPGPGAAWDGHAWAGLASAFNQKMTDWVICAPAKVSYRAASGLMPQPSGFGEASATCPATTRLVGGGVRVPEFGPTQRDVDVRPTIFSPFDGADGDSLPDDGWQIEADDWGAGGDLSIQSTAICLH